MVERTIARSKVRDTVTEILKLWERVAH
jgi:hypothetical protein